MRAIVLSMMVVLLTACDGIEVTTSSDFLTTTSTRNQWRDECVDQHLAGVDRELRISKRVLRGECKDVVRKACSRDRINCVNN